MGATVHNYRANLLIVGGVPIQPAADDFFSVALAADYEFGDTIGAGARPIQETTDRSATVTVRCGDQTDGHLVMGRLYQAQETARGLSGRTPTLPILIRKVNGDAVTGLGIIGRPTTMDGGAAAQVNEWTLMISEARPVFAGPELAALLAAAQVPG